jgi:hypothetical protein
MASISLLANTPACLAEQRQQLPLVDHRAADRMRLVRLGTGLGAHDHAIHLREE